MGAVIGVALAQKVGASIDRKVSVSIPDPCSLRVEVSSAKIDC